MRSLTITLGNHFANADAIRLGQKCVSANILTLLCLAVLPPHVVGGAILNASYVKPVFKQSFPNVERYSLATIEALVARN